MADLESQAFYDGTGRHLLLYDGHCGLCSRLVQFVLRRDRRGVFHFASLQSEAGRAVVPDADLTTFYAIANYRTAEAMRLSKSRAALFVMGSLGWPWKLVGLFDILPTALLDRLYDLVARNRYRVFGRREQCMMPRSEYRSRFIDS